MRAFGIRIFGFWVCFGFWILILGFPRSAQALEVGGYYENDIVGVVKRDGGLAAGDLSRLRLKIDSKLNPNLAFHLEPRYYFLLKSENLPLTGVTGLDQLIWDKVYIKTYLPLFSITAGKQRIAWGTGYLWNPTDIFNPFVLSFAVKEEETTNAEALRLEVPLGTASGIDGYVVTGRPWESTPRGLRLKGNVGLFDLSASYVDQGNLGHQLGFDTVGEVWGLGVRGEVAFKSAGYTQTMLGWDYTLDNGIGLMMEYYFNGQGRKDKNNYDWNGYYAGTISQLGMDYLFFNMNKLIDEITSIKGSIVINLNDYSFLIYPQYTRNMMQNLDVSLEAMILGGQEGSEFNPGSLYDQTGFGGSKLVLVRMIYSF